MSEKLYVKTPMGTLVAYPSEDPDNPGIFIDLMRDGDTAQLNLSGTECQISEDTGDCKIVSHIWGRGDHEDTTHDETHVNIDKYFKHDAV